MTATAWATPATRTWTATALPTPATSVPAQSPARLWTRTGALRRRWTPTATEAATPAPHRRAPAPAAREWTTARRTPTPDRRISTATAWATPAIRMTTTTAWTTWRR